MIKNGSLEVILHIEIREEFGMINITEFSVNNIPFPSDIIEDFIRSDYYLKDSRTDIARQNPNNNLHFLPPPFVLENIYVNDFKEMNKVQVQKYLFDFRDREDWGDDRESFENLARRFYELYPSFDNPNFYLLNMDWFIDHKRGTKEEDTDSRLIWPTWWIYTFFILLIWVDPVKQTLTVTEWYYE